MDPNIHIWGHMGTCDTHKICFQGVGEVETVDDTPRVIQANTSARAHVDAKTRNARRGIKIKTSSAGGHSHTYGDVSLAFLQSAMVSSGFYAPANTDRCVRDPRTSKHAEALVNTPSFPQTSTVTGYHSCCSAAHVWRRARLCKGCEQSCTHHWRARWFGF